MRDLFIRAARLERERIPSYDDYPFNLATVRNLNEIVFTSKVTFFAGENGSGKSTLLEALAIAFGFNPEGGTRNFNFSTKDTHSRLCDFIRLVKGAERPRDGFFFRAESFYNVATTVDSLYDEDPSPRFRDLYGGNSLHAMSHGESFFALFMNRFSGKGIYLLDEPEAALSPSRQLSVLSRLHELVKSGSQFIIATHSPIIMAYPGSRILLVDRGLEPIDYEETEHYQVMRGFMQNREKMLSILFEE